MTNPNCEQCNGTGEIEIMGDGANFEWDVIAVKPCICTTEDTFTSVEDGETEDPDRVKY